MPPESIAALPEQGAVALVCYVREDVCDVFRTLRKALPSSYDARPHITLLPPRPLSLPIRDLIHRVSCILATQTAFTVGLKDVALFAETNLLYFEIEEGVEQLHELHSRLNADELRHDEAYDFKPHLTIGGPYDTISAPTVLAEAKALWKASPCSRQIHLGEVVLLWLAPSDRQRDCRYLATFTLDGKQLDEHRALAATTADQTSAVADLPTRKHPPVVLSNEQAQSQ